MKRTVILLGFLLICGILSAQTINYKSSTICVKEFNFKSDSYIQHNKANWSFKIFISKYPIGFDENFHMRFKQVSLSLGIVKIYPEEIENGIITQTFACGEDTNDNLYIVGFNRDIKKNKKDFYVEDFNSGELLFIIRDIKEADNEVNKTYTSYEGYENGHKWVDLGLSVKWASCNVEASSPSSAGNYYAFGEVSSKVFYGWNSYLWCNGSPNTLTKYNNKSEYGYRDNRTSLLLWDDVAHLKWGGNWRLPTKNEFEELKKNCVWTWATSMGISGYNVTSMKNGRSIFIPAVGYTKGNTITDFGSRGFYWSTSLYTKEPFYAWSCYFDISGIHFYGNDRYYGFPIRPVCE